MSKKKFLVDNMVANILGEAKAEIKDTQNEIKENIKIFSEFQSLIPPLTEEELGQLEQNILAEGCRESLIVWQNGDDYVLIDGHNRYQICKKNQIDFKIQLKTFSNAENVKEWMIVNQLGKRNLTELQKSYLRGLQYKNEKRKEATIENLKQFTDVDNLTTSEKEGKRMVEKLSEIHKVSPKTIQRDEKFALGIDMLVKDDVALKNQILSKQIKIPTGTLQKLANSKTEEVEKIKTEIQDQYISKVSTTLQDSTQISKDKLDKVKEVAEPSLQKQVASIIKKLSEEKLKKLLDYLSSIS